MVSPLEFSPAQVRAGRVLVRIAAVSRLSRRGNPSSSYKGRPGGEPWVGPIAGVVHNHTVGGTDYRSAPRIVRSRDGRETGSCCSGRQELAKALIETDITWDTFLFPPPS